MRVALVKIDVACCDLDLISRKVYDLVDGGADHGGALLWVFNLATDSKSHRRDLRFWRPELFAHAQKGTTYSGLKLEQVIAQILPVKRLYFQAGELDVLFQIRPNTRLDYGAALPGILKGRSHIYPRAAVAEFLQLRWIGAATANRLKRRLA